MRAIEVPAQEQRMEGNLFIPNLGKDSYSGVIFLHGMTSSQKKYIPMAEALMQRGIAAMTVNLRGHGNSNGTLDSLTAIEGRLDGFAAFDYFANQKGIDAQRIGICGSSFGSMLAAFVAEERPIKSLLLRVPAAYSESMMHTNYQELMSNEFGVFGEIEDVEACASIQAMKDYTGGLFVMASENDLVIPLRIPEAYVAAATKATSKEFEVVKDAPHSLNGEEALQAFTQRMLSWFEKTL